MLKRVSITNTTSFISFPGARRKLLRFLPVCPLSDPSHHRSPTAAFSISPSKTSCPSHAAMLTLTTQGPLDTLLADAVPALLVFLMQPMIFGLALSSVRPHPFLTPSLPHPSPHNESSEAEKKNGKGHIPPHRLPNHNSTTASTASRPSSRD